MGEVCSGIEHVDGSISRLLALLFVSVSIFFKVSLSASHNVVDIW